MKRKIFPWLAIGLVVVLLLLVAGGLWFSTNQLLAPVFRGATHDFSVCKEETKKHWGESCGNLRQMHQLAFSEVRVPSVNGYDLPGWLIETVKNGRGAAKGAIILIPAGGSDRREATRLVPFFLGQHLDVLAVDLGCQGEAPCPVPGLSYGARESRDVFSTYLYLRDKYEKVFAMGSSVGAAAILVALPEMPRLAGAIAENPMASFQRLITEAPQSKSVPRWATNVLLKVTMLRGRFDGLASPAHSLPLAKTTPVFFIHSKQDTVARYQQTEELAASYSGPKVVWLPDQGSHAAIWEANRAEWEKRVSAFLDGEK